jgi:hypothetical protein
LRSGLGGAKHSQLRVLEGVHQTITQRSFRPDDSQIDPIIERKANQFGEIRWLNIDIFGIDCGTRIARRDKDSIYSRALFDFPRQCVLASTITNNETIHDCGL